MVECCRGLRGEVSGEVSGEVLAGRGGEVSGVEVVKFWAGRGGEVLGGGSSEVGGGFDGGKGKIRPSTNQSGEIPKPFGR